MSMARLSITDCVMPISLSPVFSCMAKCRDSSAVPVVTPQRIVSTDKKALQLGGRQVALDGQPVRPTDEVNVAKKYQLIALE